MVEPKPGNGVEPAADDVKEVSSIALSSEAQDAKVARVGKAYCLLLLQGSRVEIFGPVGHAMIVAETSTKALLRPGMPAVLKRRIVGVIGSILYTS